MRKHRFHPRNLVQPVSRRARRMIRLPADIRACECGSGIFIDYQHGVWACRDRYGCGIQGVVLANGDLVVTARPVVLHPPPGQRIRKGSRLAKLRQEQAS